MKQSRRVVTFALAVLFAAGMALSTGCTKYAGPEDMKTLDEAQKAAVAAEGELEKTRAERRKVEKELADAEAELEAAQGELKAVQAP